MKLALQLSGLIAAAVFCTVAPAASETASQRNLQTDNQSSPLLLAEGGSDRLMDYHSQNSLVKNQPEPTTSEQYVQMLKEQPTASGVNPTSEALQQTTESQPKLTSPIIRDREEYRSAH